MTSNDEKSICGTCVTIDLVEQVIKTKIPSDSKITEFKADDIGTDKGFLSVMARIHLTWTPVDGNLPDSIIAKIPTSTKINRMSDHMGPGMTDMAENATKNLDKIHNCEAASYKMFSTLEKSPVQIPYVYGVKELMEGGELTDPAYILMEDLADKAGILSFLEMAQATKQQHVEIFEMLGSLHAWSLKNMDLVEKSMKTVDILDILFTMTGDNAENQFEGFMTAMHEPMWKMNLGEELVSKLGKLRLEMSREEMAYYTELNKKFNVPSVMNHGDVHMNNLMFAKGDDGKPSGKLVAVVDWQCVNISNPCMDLARIMASVPPNERSRPERNAFLDKYYGVFESEFDGAVPFKREDLYECFEETYQYIVRLFMPMMPGIFKMISSRTDVPLTVTKELVLGLLAQIPKLIKLRYNEGELPLGLQKELTKGLIARSMAPIFQEAVDFVESKE